MDQESIAKFLTAMGDKNRLQIIFLLRDTSLNVSEIAEQFDISRPAVSHHLKVLKEAKVLLSQKAGQEIYYSINKQFIITELRLLADELENQAFSE